MTGAPRMYPPLACDTLQSTVRYLSSLLAHIAHKRSLDEAVVCHRIDMFVAIVGLLTIGFVVAAGFATFLITCFA